MTQSPSIPKGTRDFSSTEMIQRNFIFDTIKSIFSHYGFLPIETPAMENLTTLLGKYGDEGDKLLFKIMNSGEKANDTNPEKGLRYDLTVPFARFVVQHQNDIILPFKRYQIQPVWRADRPQKGRYREFYQCDVDVVGSDSLLNEVELIQIVNDVFTTLNINVTLKINNRKILAGIAEAINATEHIIDITVAIDKIEKIGLDNVNAELLSKNLSQDSINKLQPFLKITGSRNEKIQFLKDNLNNDIGQLGISELSKTFQYLDNLNLSIPIELDLTLARGLNYYTGAIFEVKANDVEIGSITGGGRYDDLTGIFGAKGLSGVGISFGADRIYDVMTQLNLFPKDNFQSTKILFANFGGDDEIYSLKILQKVRQNGINAEIYPDPVKMKKQMAYADRKNIPFVALCGENERNTQTITLKNMTTSQQNTLTFNELIEIVKI